MTTGSPSYTLVYDGQCRVCTRLVSALRPLDHELRIELAPSQGSGVRERFPWIPPHAFDGAIQLVANNGDTWEGARALEQLISVLPRGRWIAWTFRIPFARPVAETLYRWFARNRYRLDCAQHCRPTGQDEGTKM